MTIQFPNNLDNLTNPTGTDEVAVVSHAGQHADANDAIEAIEAKVGVDNSAVTTSHDYKLSNVADGDKAVSVTGTETLTNKTLTSPTINSAVINSPTGIVKGDVGLGNVTNDAQVTLTGNQTVAGVKTFSSSPIIPDPINPQEPVTKAYFEANSSSGASDILNNRIGGANSFGSYITDSLNVKLGSTTSALYISTQTEYREFTGTEFNGNINGLSVYNGDVYVLSASNTFISGQGYAIKLYKVEDVETDLVGAAITEINISTNSVMSYINNRSSSLHFSVLSGFMYFYDEKLASPTTKIVKSQIIGNVAQTPTTITLSGNTIATNQAFIPLDTGDFIFKQGTAYERVNSSGVSQVYFSKYLNRASTNSDLIGSFQDGVVNVYEIDTGGSDEFFGLLIKTL